MARRRRKGKAGKWVGRILTAVLAVPALYLLAAFIGSLVPVNRGLGRTAEGTTVYIADNGIHADIIMPVKAEGVDWAPLIPKSDFAAPTRARAGSPSARASGGSISTRRRGGTSGRARSGRRSPAASA